MADNYMVRLYSQYLSDKAEINSFLNRQKISPTGPSTLDNFLGLCEKWEHLPFFKRRMEPYHRQLIALRKKGAELSDFVALPPAALPANGSITTSRKSPLATLNYDFTATPEKIHRFFENRGIIGEQGNQEILVYGALARTNLGIESLSGSGKSALLYALLEALPKERYKVIHQATGKSLFQDQDASGLDFWVIPELQKVFNPEIEEIVKNLTEGVSATHTRTNSSKTGIDFLEIKKKAVLYSFAVTNRHGKKRDEEFYRRFIILHTDISTRQTLEVALRYAERDFVCEEEREEDDLFRSHLAGCLSSVKNVRNPFLDYIIKSLPEEISSPLRFRSAVKYFQSLVKGKTLYSSAGPERISPKLFSTLEDNQRVISLYAQTLFENIHSVSVVEKAILNLVQEKELSPEELNREFKEKYGELPLFKESLERLQGKGFVGRENGTLKAIPWPKIQVDPEEAIFAADILMQKEFPQYRDQWYQKNMELLR